LSTSAAPVAILNVGRVDGNAQQEAERVDEYMSLAARDLFAGVPRIRFVLDRRDV